MPQEFIVVRCFDCETFQSQQVKKTSKWQCKMCGQKQSLKKVYGKGTGADCRKLVQSLNLTSGELREAEKQKSDQLRNMCSTSHGYEVPEESGRGDTVQTSKWEDFIEQPVVSTEECGRADHDEHVTTERPLPFQRGGSQRSISNRSKPMRTVGSKKRKRNASHEGTELQIGRCGDGQSPSHAGEDDLSVGLFPRGGLSGSNILREKKEERPANKLQKLVGRQYQEPQSSQVKGSVGNITRSGAALSSLDARKFTTKIATSQENYQLKERDNHMVQQKTSGEPTSVVNSPLVHDLSENESGPLKIDPNSRKVVTPRKVLTGNSKWDAFLEDDVENIPEEKYDDVGDEIIGRSIHSDMFQTVFSLGEEAEEDLSWDD